MRIALKPCAWQRRGKDLVVMFDPRRTVTLADPRHRVELLLTELREGPRSLDALRLALAGRGLSLHHDGVRESVLALDRLGLVEDGADLTLAAPADTVRNESTLAFFSAFSRLEQGRGAFVRRLRSAHVVQLGVGGLGCVVVQCLVGMGVGRFTLVDNDVVDASNLTRQFLYRPADIGRPKVRRAAEWVREYDPSVEVRPLERRVAGPDDVRSLLGDTDVVVAAIDDPDEASLWVNEACVSSGVPVTGGGVRPTQMTYYSVDPGRSACLACFDLQTASGEPERTAIHQHLLRRYPRTNRGTGPAVSIMGGLIAFEAVRFITGFQPPATAGGLTVVDMLDGCSSQRMTVTPHPDCPVCRTAPGVDQRTS